METKHGRTNVQHSTPESAYFAKSEHDAIMWARQLRTVYSAEAYTVTADDGTGRVCFIAHKVQPFYFRLQVSAPAPKPEPENQPDFLQLIYGAPVYFNTMTIAELREAAQRCDEVAKYYEDGITLARLAGHRKQYVARIFELTNDVRNGEQK